MNRKTVSKDCFCILLSLVWNVESGLPQLSADPKVPTSTNWKPTLSPEPMPTQEKVKKALSYEKLRILLKNIFYIEDLRKKIFGFFMFMNHKGGHLKFNAFFHK
jgi:hypothetical protein